MFGWPRVPGLILLSALLLYWPPGVQAGPLPPGPAVVYVACGDMAAVRQAEAMLRSEAWSQGRAIPTDHVRAACYQPQRRPGAISIQRALEKFGPTMDVVKCFQDFDGDGVVILFTPKASRYPYTFWYRIPARAAACAAGFISSADVAPEV